MPLYEYRCKACNERREVLQRWQDKAPTCKQCATPMAKQVSTTSFQLVGPGWARDNYGLSTGER